MASPQRKAVERELDKFTSRLMARTQALAFQALTSASPVLTGFFRSRWSPSTGSPDVSAASNRPSNPDAARAVAAGAFSQHSRASQRLASSYRAKQGPIFITNNASYGPALNSGTSAQAPAMFVERAIAAAVRAASREFK